MKTPTILMTVLMLLLAGLLLAGCGGEADDEALSAADFGVAPSTDDHDDGHDHSHDDEPEEPVFDPSLTETEDEGVFIDHHGNRIVDELYQKYEEQGIKLEFTVENFLGVGGRGGEVSSDIRAGERALIKFKISDAESEEALTGLRPAAWMDLLSAGALDANSADTVCKDRVEGYLSGMLTARPTLDLNSFFILALNGDPSISIIDPTVDVAGMTQLFALIQLTGPGQDWALSDDHQRLFVTVPSMNQVAVVEMDGFSLAIHLDGGNNPQRIAFQPNQGYVWVGNDSSDEASGVTAIDPATLETVAFIPTGEGHHELAFSPDSQTLFVTNSEAGTLSVIDTTKLEEVAELDAGRSPGAVTYVNANQTVYVADSSTGDILVLDGTTLEPVTTIETGPGLAELAFAPGGRWAFAANPERGTITIIDASSHQVTHEAQVGGAPDQITFSDSAAYIRSRDAALVNTIQLADLAPDSQLEVASVPVGQQAPGVFPSLPLANAVHPIGSQAAMVIANPADDQVYFYPEGATSTSGSFQGHGLFPRAVTIIDRSLREDAPGVYTGRLRVPQEGEYLVALMLGDPLLVHCFEFTAKPNADLEQAAANLPEVAYLNEELRPVVGQPFTLQLKLVDPASGAGVEGVQDVFVLASQAAGNWNSRAVAAELGDGVYEVQLTMPQAGLYTVFIAAPSLGLNAGQLPTLNLQVTAGG